MEKCDYIVVGAGIVGLAVARALQARVPGARIVVIDKEADVGAHSSGRNSGVLHAGFYYTASSLKARFTVQGNHAMKAYCLTRKVPVNQSGKLVAAMDEQELNMLFELEKRGIRNGSNVRIIDLKEAKDLEPGIFTFKKALYSPATASLDPMAVLKALKEDLCAAGVALKFGVKFLGHTGRIVHTSGGDIESRKFINCAGLYADKVAQNYGFGLKYTMIPFKGLYLKYTKNHTDVRINIYPVPNLKNPFLGVHFTKTVDGAIKIGPTAIPAFWRENYSIREGFAADELGEIAWEQSRLFFRNSFGFRDLAFEEIRKYNREYFIGLAVRLVPSIDPRGFGAFTRPGIRAQLLDKERRELVQDFVVEADNESVHILNAVSPAFTCAFPFADFLLEQYIFK